MADPIIKVENLGKRYRITHQQQNGMGYKAARDVLADKTKSLARRVWSAFSAPSNRNSEIGSLNSVEDFWALREVSFEIKQGEVVGIIGRNGAGKSTLLKVLSRITEPTEGRVQIKGRVASLLEVGTGFHPELTGRENIFLNGAILGMPRVEIRKKFDEIVAFAEVERFLDTPVKRYSSGMYVRLAFAVAAHLEPEILIVDEVLAVGDAQFQKKCLGKMQSVSSREGRTVLFVSHNMVAVQSLCRRALHLQQARLIADDAIAPVVASYLKAFHGQDDVPQWDDPKTAPGNEKLRIKCVRLVSKSSDDYDLITMQTPFQIETEYWVLDASRLLHFTYHLINDQGVTVLTSGTPPQVYEAGLHRAVCKVPGQLLNSGGYYLKLFVVEDRNRVTYINEGVASFTVVDTAKRIAGAWTGHDPGVVRPGLDWQIERISSVSAASF